MQGAADAKWLLAGGVEGFFFLAEMLRSRS